MVTTPPLLVGTQVNLEVGGTGQSYWAFPSITRCPNDELLAVYYGAGSHVGPAGNLYTKRSTDHGATWSTRSLLVDNAYDNRDPGLSTLSDGRVVVSFTETDNSAYTPNATFWRALVAFSSDNGATFGTPVEVPAGPGLVWNFTTAPVVELTNGELVLPYYGSDTLNAGDDVCRLAVSTDGGATWADRSTIAAAAGKDLNEPVVVLLSDGQTLACFIRNSTDNQIERTLSTDGGATWGARQFVTSGNGRPAAGLTADGLVLLQFRDGGTNDFHYLALDASADPASAGAEINLASGSGDVMVYGGWCQRASDSKVVSVFAIENPGNVYVQAIDSSAVGSLWVPPEVVLEPSRSGGGRRRGLSTGRRGL